MNYLLVVVLLFLSYGSMYAMVRPVRAGNITRAHMRTYCSNTDKPTNCKCGDYYGTFHKSSLKDFDCALRLLNSFHRLSRVGRIVEKPWVFNDELTDAVIEEEIREAKLLAGCKKNIARLNNILKYNFSENDRALNAAKNNLAEEIEILLKKK